MDNKQRGLLQATVTAGIALGVASATGCFANPIYCCPISNGDQGIPDPSVPRIVEKAVVCELDGLPIPGDAGLPDAEVPSLSASPDGTHIYVHKTTTTYRLKVNPGCFLTVDESFADSGYLRAPTTRIFETDAGIFVSDAKGVHLLGSEAACTLPGLLTITDSGDRAFSLAPSASDDKSVVSTDPRACPSVGTPSEGKLRSVEHVAAGVGKTAVYFATVLQNGKASLIETYDPVKGQVTLSAPLTTNTPYPQAPPVLGVEAIRGCGNDEICVATGPKPALNRFDKGGTIIVRQQLDALDYLPEPVRAAVSASRVALTRDGRAFYPYMLNGKFGIVQVSVNYTSSASDGGVQPKPDAAPDSGSDSSDSGSDSSTTSDASDAGSD